MVQTFSRCKESMFMLRSCVDGCYGGGEDGGGDGDGDGDGGGDGDASTAYPLCKSYSWNKAYCRFCQRLL